MRLFEKNVGTTDRLVRIVVGVVLLSLTVFGPATPWGWLGLIPLATGVFNTCPLYSVLGVDTHGKKGGPGAPAVHP